VGAPGRDQCHLDHLRGRGPGTFTVTTSGYPAPSLGETGTLPAGITWTDNGNGTATLAGTPDAVTAATTYPITIQATDGTGTTTQSFTLTVAPAPVSGGTIPPVGTPPAVATPTPTPTSALAGGDRLAATPDGLGYWIVGTNGSVTAYGTAGNYGSMAGHVLNQPIVGVASTPDGKGYWLVASDGGIFSFGDAQLLRVHRQHQAQPAHRGHHRHPRREGLLDGGLRRRGVQLR
jgi:hypothetical protein